MNKKELSERDICTKFINPALQNAGWDMRKQVREEVTFTDGRIIVQGKLHTRGTKKRADYILYYKNNQPIAIIEAKDNKKSVGSGMQQALEYSDILDIPFVFTSIGDSFVFHDKTNQVGLPKLALHRVAKTLLPLPPLEEQKAIVGKVHALMALCDKLETEIETRETTLEHWMQSWVRGILENHNN